MKVSIITEGFQHTGYGHITRCLSLYQAFVEQKITPTFYINTDENSKPFLTDSNYKIVDWLTHPTRLVNDVINSDIMIIDSYLAGKEFYEIFSKLSKISLFIDDYMRLDYPTGIILNGTINSELFPYPKKHGCDYLLGVEYIPIRKEFWNQQQRKLNQKISSLLITFGAQDVKNLTPQVTKVIQQNFPEINIKVVFGSENLPPKEIEDLKSEKTDLLFAVDAQQMKNLMLSSDVAISAAGQTLYELAVTGLPTIAVAVAENQRNNILEWKKAGFIIDPIFHGDHNYLRKIIEQIETLSSISLRKKLNAVGKQKVDGKGPIRVINFLLDKTS